jgi:hypothetical protein
MLGIGSITFKSRLIASTAPTAINIASTRFNQTVGASIAPSAFGTVFARRHVGMIPVLQQAIASTYSIDPQVRISFASVAQANAYASATIRMAYKLSGSGVATAIAQSAASDFASAVTAPAERLMKVPASNRRMEVTE